jgi:imidazolonepropionase-like amidohydrolase
MTLDSTPAIKTLARSIAFLTLSVPVIAQFADPQGLQEARLRTTALRGAMVVVAPGEEPHEATILIRDGRLIAVGANVEIPPGTLVHDIPGQWVYPGLIDAGVEVDVARPGSAGEKGRHWNSMIQSDVDLSSGLGAAEIDMAALRQQGFTVVAALPEHGIFAGSAAVLPLLDDAKDRHLYLQRGPMSASFDRSSSGYPGSKMGSIALARQTLADATWFVAAHQAWSEDPAQGEPPGRHAGLEALAAVVDGSQTLFWAVGDERDALRADTIAREFDLDVVLVGSGLEFRRLDEIVKTKRAIILPVDFPSPPDVASSHVADRLSLRELQTWKLAPSNPARLKDRGVEICLTTRGLSKISDFFSNVRKAIAAGLSEADALAAVTTRPAAMLAIDEVVGTIEPGKFANLVVSTGPLFDEGSEIRSTWVHGVQSVISWPDRHVITGSGPLTIDDGTTVQATFDARKKTFSVRTGDEAITRAKKVTVTGDRVVIVIDGTPLGLDGYVRFNGTLLDDLLLGQGVDGSGRVISFTMEIEPAPTTDEAEGEWVTTTAQEKAIVIELTSIASDTIKGEVTINGVLMKIKNGTWSEGDALTLTAENDDGTANALTLQLDGDQLAGTWTTGDDQTQVTLSRVVNDETAVDVPREPLPTPLGAYGRLSMPPSQTVRIDHATIWTAGDGEIIEDGCLQVSDGVVTWIGPLPGPPPRAGEMVIDGTGKHITPGLIDCHSHTGINGGVNESRQANTAEVRIGDVLDVDDVNWYRQLAGGLTTSHQLHGSANPIGGQDAVVKLKWGGSVDDFSLKTAAPGIKFALGENVKRSTSRYPNTRMGVEAFIRDAFARGADYGVQWSRYTSLPTWQQARTVPPRRDLELEAIAEILAGERRIHCHSYRQDEILALLRLCEEYGVTVGTLQHVLEGYKVAEAIAAHGAGASSFSDWWAYKVEVMDAIPYNGALMDEVGVLVSFNSDSSNLARRMNIEAAKAVRYGGVDPHDALKFVTINPAIQLGIGDRTGSLEIGKDADFVLWSGPPLSTLSRCEQTWIEGRRFFDINEDAQLRAAAAAAHGALVQEILSESHGELKNTELSVAAWRSEVGRWADPPPAQEAMGQGVCGCLEVDGGASCDH